MLKLGPPASGELIIKVDPQRSGSAFAMGTETILPGAAIPVHRHLHQDELLFVHKGQGRATLNGQTVTVVSGSTIYVPRQSWHGLRNTGTGILEVTWTVAPAGVEQFFRDLAKLGDRPDASAVQAVAARHGVEFHPEGEPSAVTTPGGRRTRHGRHRRGGGRRPGKPHVPPSAQGPQRPQAATPTPAEVVPAAAPSPAPQQGSRSGRRRRHRGRGRGAPQGQPVAGAPPPARTAPPPSGGAPQHRAAGRSTPPKDQRRREGRGRRYGRVKEVYMGGKWIRVTGEGPVIAPGKHDAADESSEGR